MEKKDFIFLTQQVKARSDPLGLGASGQNRIPGSVRQHYGNTLATFCDTRKRGTLGHVISEREGFGEKLCLFFLYDADKDNTTVEMHTCSFVNFASSPAA